MGGGSGIVVRFPRLAALCLPFLVMSGPASAACSDSVPFFTYGACSRWKETRLEAPKLGHTLFAPAVRSWRISSNGGGEGARQDIFTAAKFSDPEGRSGQAQFAIRCERDTTTARFRFTGYEMGNKGAQREIVYRIDDGGEQIIELDRASDSDTLAIDQGYRAVPFLRRLMGGKKLRISAIAANGKELRAVLHLEGMEQAIAKLRSACHW